MRGEWNVIYLKPKPRRVSTTDLWKEDQKCAPGEALLWARYDIWIFNSSSPLGWVKFHSDNCTKTSGSVMKKSPQIQLLRDAVKPENELKTK